jgi:hypothetical protein
MFSIDKRVRSEHTLLLARSQNRVSTSSGKGRVPGSLPHRRLAVEHVAKPALGRVKESLRVQPDRGRCSGTGSFE